MTTEQKHEIEILECKTDQQLLACKNMKEYGDSFDYERYRCDVCGKRMKLHYEEMR